MSGKLTHLNEDGEVHMVDVGAKSPSQRQAVATSKISMSTEAFKAVLNGNLKKGDALGVARVAGIMAAKNTANMIPLCHPLALTKVEISIEPDDATASFAISALVRVEGKTGVEMEALSAASVTALTIYDMAKALDKSMIIGPTQLEQKSGGKSGNYKRE
ncbi:cyclic pyranopterin monophosphate synthase MoaC [Maritalea sp.]|uniref:cyclic pyranopterin monophosphate synthase MoaC n=1 Tax=Maritalea sp. TaxID=2003361 RepID=UPI003EF738DD